MSFSGVSSLLLRDSSVYRPHFFPLPVTSGTLLQMLPDGRKKPLWSSVTSSKYCNTSRLYKQIFWHSLLYDELIVCDKVWHVQQDNRSSHVLKIELYFALFWLLSRVCMLNEIIETTYLSEQYFFILYVIAFLDRKPAWTHTHLSNHKGQINVIFSGPNVNRSVFVRARQMVEDITYPQQTFDQDELTSTFKIYRPATWGNNKQHLLIY